MKKTNVMKHIITTIIGVVVLVVCLSGILFAGSGFGERRGTKSTVYKENLEAGMKKQIHRIADGDRVSCLNLWSTSGTASASPMTVYYDSQDAGIQTPQVIYVRDEQANSVFCIHYGATLSSGNIIDGCSEEAYESLNTAQKAAISQVLGSATFSGAPRDEEQGYVKLNTGECTFDNFQRYVSTQLMLWYYIDLYSDAPGSGNTGGITWNGVERTCNAGWGNLDECWQIWERVSTNYNRPSFTGETVADAQEIELKYNVETGIYETIITDSTDILQKFQIMNSDDLQCIRCDSNGNENAEGNALLIRSESPIEDGTIKVISLQRRVNGSTIYYLMNQTEDQDMVFRGGGLDLLVDAYVKVRTERVPTVVVEKRDRDTDKLLSGVRLQILEGNSILEEWVTTGEIYISKRLKPGHTYILHEVQTPNGYLQGQDIAFTVEDTMVPQIVTMYNKRTTIEISKIDAETGRGLPDAELELYQGDKLLETWISGDTSHTIRGLQVGTIYRLCEKLAPTGYKRIQDMEFTVTGEENQKIIVENQRIQGSVRLKKIDSESGEGLSGAVVELYKKEDSEMQNPIGTYTSDEKGSIRIDNLDFGEYYIIEMTAPEGYLLSDEKISFAIDGSLELLELELSNIRKEEVTTEEATTEEITTEEVTTEEMTTTTEPEEEPSTLVAGATIQKATPKTKDTAIPVWVFIIFVFCGMVCTTIYKKK